MRYIRKLLLHPIIAATTLGMFATSSMGGELMVIDAWSPQAPPAASTHAAYISLHNMGETPRVLVAVSSTHYAMAHIHQSKETDGVSSMMMIDRIKIPVGAVLSMKPGGFHVMLMRPKSAMNIGDKLPLSLTFENGEILNIDVIVKDHNAAS